MGQDLCASSSLENAITDQFTPPHLSMLHLSLAKCTWFEMKRGNGLCLWTLSKHSWIVCHMLYHAQVAYQNDFKLERIHPSCSRLIWGFTLHPLSFNTSLLIGIFFLLDSSHTVAGHASVQHAHTVQQRDPYNCFPVLLLWRDDWRARAHFLKW